MIISKIRSLINRLIHLLKWPCAVFMVLSLPVLYFALKRYIEFYILPYGWSAHMGLVYFAVGFAFMVLAKFVFMPRHGGSQAADTMEHELTHAIFAWLTLHRVTDIETSDAGGGAMTFRGGGNWLIAVAPYFFPTLSAGVILVAYAFYKITGTTPVWIFIALGCTTGYHFFSTISETHAGQTDLQKVGFPFSFSFLPGANIYVFAILLAFSHRGLKGVSLFFQLMELTVRSFFS